MRGLTLDIGFLPLLLAGVVVGAVAFGILMLVLLPVIRGARRASIPRGLLAVMVSFALMLAGAVALHLVLAPSAVLAFVAGEVAGLVACWTILAVALVARGRDGRSG